jgi:hypothetical protein
MKEPRLGVDIASNLVEAGNARTQRLGIANCRFQEGDATEWIPNDPTFVAQLLRISASYSPPPPEGFVSPMTWGVKENVIERFAAAGVPGDRISFERATYRFNFPGRPSELLTEFRKYYGPTINAFEAATASGRVSELHSELEALCNEHTANGNEAPHLNSCDLPTRQHFSLNGRSSLRGRVQHRRGPLPAGRQRQPARYGAGLTPSC